MNVCLHICNVYYMHTWCQGDQRRELDPLEQELQRVESCHMGPGTELGSSVRTASLQPQHEVSFT